MWWAGSKRQGAIDVLLTRQAVLCVVAGKHHVHQNPGSAPGELLAQALRSAVPRADKQAIRLWLSGHWARPFLLAPVAGVHRWPEWQALAQAMAAQQTGLVAPCAVWFSAAPGKTAVLVVATPQNLASECQSAAQQANCRLVQMRPWWNAALNHMLASPAPADAHYRTVAAIDADSMTVLSGSAGRFTLASTTLPPPVADQVPAALARLGFARGVELGAISVLLCISPSETTACTGAVSAAPFIATADTLAAAV